MSVRTIRARVHAGRFEPLEQTSIPPEGTELSLRYDEPEDETTPTEPVVVGAALTLGSYPLGAPARLTRADFYDDDR